MNGPGRGPAHRLESESDWGSKPKLGLKPSSDSEIVSALAAPGASLAVTQACIIIKLHAVASWCMHIPAPTPPTRRRVVTYEYVSSRQHMVMASKGRASLLQDKYSVSRVRCIAMGESVAAQGEVT